MTTEHLKILLDSAPGSSMLGDVASLFARRQLPEDILTAVRVGDDCIAETKEASGALLSGTCSAGWLPAPSPSSLQSRPRVPPTLSSTPSPRGRGRSV